MIPNFSDFSALSLIMALIGGYLLGSIAFGLVITRLAGLEDIRKIGSGNIGATNVLRTGRRWLAALTLFGDIGKGFAAVTIASQWGEPLGLVAGLGAFLGHLYPFWLHFKGGKGVATYLGILAGVSLIAAVAFAAIWLAVAFISRYSSLSALAASLATPFVLALLGHGPGIGLFTILTALVFIRHHANITRLVKGKESKIGGTAK
ncbi:MAG TPA: glycerol-3-phosphate 1-O-acyltransferase PlsY [Hyphomicrobiales bacterium]|nr:glycerol-3-phosphate 1-O-acyltransferase PlsY [Hyphomicrobiales bacterium]